MANLLSLPVELHVMIANQLCQSCPDCSVFNLRNTCTQLKFALSPLSLNLKLYNHFTGAWIDGYCNRINTNTLDIIYIQQLLEQGAYVDWIPKKPCDYDPDIALIPLHRTSLHIAAELGQFDTVKLLLSYGAKVNREDGERNRPLELAIRRKHEHVARLLLDNGAEAERVVQPGELSIEEAAEAEWDDPGSYMRPREIRIESALFYATEADNVGLMRTLIEKGAFVDGGEASTPPLFMVESAGAARVLLEAFAEVNPVDCCHGVWQTPVSHFTFMMENGDWMRPRDWKGILDTLEKFGGRYEFHAYAYDHGPEYNYYSDYDKDHGCMLCNLRLGISSRGR